MNTKYENLNHEGKKALFHDAKDRYSAMRSAERKRIVEYLRSDSAFSELSRGQGKTSYTSKHTLDPPYDASNWKWITGRCGGINFLLSLQTFDIDESSHNIHALFDRIGLYLYNDKSAKLKPGYIPIDKQYTDDGKELLVADYFVRMKKTSFELPLSSDELSALAEYIKQEVKRINN